MQSKILPLLIVTISGASLLNSTPLTAAEIIHCKSSHSKYKYCRADTSNYATLERQISRTRCRLNHTWGYDRHGVWVDRGCDGNFKVGHDYYQSHHDYRSYDYDHDYDYDYDYDDDDHDNKKVAVATAAVAGIALIAALAKKKNQETDDEVTSWAIGEFTGYDGVEKTDVKLRIFPGGSVSGSAGEHNFTGTVAGDQLETGNYTFKIKHSGNGFEAIDENNSRHKVMFVRSDSGYRSGY